MGEHTWHYVLIYHDDPALYGESDMAWWGLHEVYRDEGAYREYTEPIIVGDTPEEVIEALEMALADIKRLSRLRERDGALEEIVG